MSPSEEIAIKNLMNKLNVFLDYKGNAERFGEDGMEAFYAVEQVMLPYRPIPKPTKPRRQRRVNGARCR